MPSLGEQARARARAQGQAHGADVDRGLLLQQKEKRSYIGSSGDVGIRVGEQCITLPKSGTSKALSDRLGNLPKHTRAAAVDVGILLGANEIRAEILDAGSF